MLKQLKMHTKINYIVKNITVEFAVEIIFNLTEKQYLLWIYRIVAICSK